MSYEALSFLIWIIGAVILSIWVWVDSAKQVANGVDKYRANDDAEAGYLLAIVWPFLLAVLPVLFLCISIGKCSDMLKMKLVKRMKRND